MLSFKTKVKRKEAKHSGLYKALTCIDSWSYFILQLFTNSIRTYSSKGIKKWIDENQSKTKNKKRWGILGQKYIRLLWSAFQKLKGMIDCISSQIMTVIEPYSTQINYLQGYFSLSLNHIGRLLFNNRKGNKC